MDGIDVRRYADAVCLRLRRSTVVSGIGGKGRGDGSISARRIR